MENAGILDVVLALHLSFASGRDVLHGLSTWTRRERCRWRLHVVNVDFAWADQELARLFERGVDCAVTHGRARGVDFVNGFCGPLVYIGPRQTDIDKRVGPLAYVQADEMAVGRAGAAHLESLGRMRAYGFAFNRTLSERCRGFKSYLEHRRADVREFGEVQNRSELEAWLRDLPKPAAVMAQNDRVALEVLDAAQSAHVKVPKEVALLGVDNDELLCETAEPPLSSVAVDHERLGALAGEALRRLLAKPPKAPFRLQAPVSGIVERQSARPVAPAAALAERAEAFIRHNATRDISAIDVASHLGVSRSLADLRFRQIHGESMLEMILRLRLEATKRKLRDTDLPIRQVARMCGFGSESRAKHLFKERFGMSMRQWRAASRQAKWS